MAQGRIVAANVTVLPQSRGRVMRVEVAALVPAPAARGRVTAVEVASVAPVALPLPVASVSLVAATNGYRLVGTASMVSADQWAWSVDGTALVGEDDATLDLFIPAVQDTTTRTVFARYRKGADWSGPVSVDVTIPEWRYWVGFNGQMIPYTPRDGAAPPVGSVARGRVAQVSVSAVEVLGEPYRDLEEMTPAVDTPTFSFAALSASAGPTVAGTSGWQREKREGTAETPPGGAQSSTADLDLTGSTRFRYPGIIQVPGASGNAGNYVYSNLKTGGGAQSARWLFNVDFVTPNTDTVQLRLLAPVTNPRLGMVLVNGRRVQATPVMASASAGAGYVATMKFPTAAVRRIKIYGLSHNMGGFGGVATPNGVVTKPDTPIQRRIVGLGDSLWNGSAGVSSVDTSFWDIARRMGADDIVQLAIGGTGFTNDGGDANGRYINRVADILALKPDVLLIIGGRNDSTAPSLRSRVAELMAATSSVPELWVVSDSVVSASNQIIREETLAAGRRFVDMSDYQELVALSDGIHPTWQGARDFAAICIERMGLAQTPPDPELLEPATGVPSTGLFFELPSSAQVNPDRKILAHYYGPQPGAFSNSATDYYETGYLPVNGEGGAHAAYGGHMRDRPMLGAPFSTTPSWQRNMQAAEITAAKQAGLNGFFCNIMGSSGDNWDRYVWMADEASANHPGFLVVPMVDANGSMAQNEAASVAAARINTMLSKSCAWRLPDGRYVVGTFKMEGRPLSYWNEVKTLLTSTYGKDTAWIGVYNNLNMATNYTGLQWSSGMWGPGADPNIYNNLTNYGTAIKGRGEKYLFGLWAQDVRPRSDLFDEARNSEALRAGLDAAVRQNADIIQFCTWSDHTEGSQVRPTVKQGQAKLDVAAYRIAKWKTGKYPRILRDAVYVSYRNQMFNATITGGQTRFMSHWARTNRSALRESVEVLTYFTSPADVTVKVGTKTYTYTAPAGEFQYLAPLSPGEVSVKAVRSSAEIARINCPIVVKSTTVNQDREYVWFSSLRGTQGQYDPTPGSPVPNPQNFLP